ncbi:MAG: glycerol-3-phosphate acyltransferase [Oscillospiraceae bacterium]|nr:glycerol-3-phosphate acyltransferase [Oscillospiraceae bacterium]
MTVLFYLSAVVSAYLLGCSNMALYLSKYKGIDLREAGSKNLGASNAMVQLGWRAGILVGLHDIGKAFLSVLAAKLLWPQLPLIGAAAGVACVLGHMFPFYLKFRGGKGFAAYLGMTLALNWRFALVVMLIVVLVTLITDYIVVGTVTTVISVPAYLGWTERSPLLFFVLCIASAVILWKHRENYVRIYRGTEIGLRRANRGDYRTTKR